MNRYRIWCPDLGQEESDARSGGYIEAQSAAEEWAEWHDWNSAEYEIVGGKERKVFVRDIDSSEISQWTVTGESVPLYRARQVLVQHT